MLVLGLGAWDCGNEFRLGFLVSYLTIEDEKKEKRGRRSFAGPEEISVLERDFDGYVLNKRIHSVSLAF
ncbi:hypothetical protein, partial [Rhizobium sp. No.120]